MYRESGVGGGKGGRAVDAGLADVAAVGEPGPEPVVVGGGNGGSVGGSGDLVADGLDGGLAGEDPVDGDDALVGARAAVGGVDEGAVVVDEG